MHQSPDDFTQANLTFSFDFFGQGEEAQMTPPSAAEPTQQSLKSSQVKLSVQDYASIWNLYYR